MMASPKFNSKSPTIRRILREAQELASSPSADYTASPLESDLFEWHFTLRGPPNSVYSQGLYHGKIVLPPTYPLRPPSFRFLTPSGRFETNREICLSISGHHEETWQPAWGVRTALVALRSFMETDAKGQLGGLETTAEVRRRMAGESRISRCVACGGRSTEDIMKEREEEARRAEEEAKTSGVVKEEIEVPPELKLGWRDEMGKVAEGQSTGESADASSKTTAAREAADDSESAELAEGFVQTVPIAALDGPQRSPPGGAAAIAATAAVPPLPAQPAQSAPQPTRTESLPGVGHAVAPPTQTQRQQRARNQAVPQWIDTIIMALGFCLIAMVLKVLLRV